MKTAFLSTAYLAPVSYYACLCRYDRIIIEKYCHYVKQTWRNRCMIATTNGLLSLSIPVEKSESPKCFTKDVRIASHGNWQHMHWNAIVSAYNSSPFFEYYEDDFQPFYEKKFKFLFDFNEELREMICRLLDISPQVTYSETFLPVTKNDYREIIHPKKEQSEIADLSTESYYQVFQQKFGFQSGLSIVDLLFNMGPESIFILLLNENAQ